jgi:hypothetical protein
MAEITAVVTPDEALTVAVSEGTYVLNSSTNLNNPAVVESISNIADIDLTTNGKVNGSVLVYKASTNKWTATTVLDSQDVTGGQY